MAFDQNKVISRSAPRWAWDHIDYLILEARRDPNADKAGMALAMCSTAGADITILPKELVTT